MAFHYLKEDFPQKWLTDGIQIKILFPFRLKSWHKSMLRSNEKKKDAMKRKKFGFLTIWGIESNCPFLVLPKMDFHFLIPF
ncbi:hypothetical protein Fmac_008266 [Flemingia macrophylla]|uniref:Uncharacterized protein n=1 Tax=Flemingia macrophylla TaxID=520843 RepID=A0ABD1MWZ1_9FABA